MFKISSALILALAIAASAVAETQSDEPRITFTSYGPARIGMSRHELEQALGSPLKNELPDADSESCEYVMPARGYEGIAFMLIGGNLARIDVSNRRVATLSGAHIGSTQAAVLSMYSGRIKVSPHAYVEPDGAYLTLHSRDGSHGIRFETDGGKVTSYYAGTAEAIRYIEGCL